MMPLQIRCRTGASLLLILVGAVACGTPGGEAEANRETEPEPPVVTVAAVAQQMIERRAQVVGQLLADEEVTVSNEVDGTVERIAVDFGSQVKSGQLLLTLRPRDNQLAVNRARAGLVESLAALGLPAEGDEDVVAIDQIPAVAMARAALEDASTKLESAAQLVKTRDIPEQRYLEAVKTAEQRQAALQSAVDQARSQIAQVKVNRAQLAIEEDLLSKTRIRAPFDGSVVARQVSPGQYVKANSQLLSLVRDHPLRLRAKVPETGAALVRKGLSVKFQTDAYPDRWFDAVVSEVSPVLDPANRTLSAEAKVPNPDRLLKPGMFAKIDVVVDPSSPALLVPEQAIVKFAGLQKVFLVSADGQLSERTVETGARFNGSVEITSADLKAGDLVVVSNPRGLQEGLKVKIAAGGV